jgi:hypothetical protein
MSVIPDGRLYCNFKENKIDKRFGSEERWNEFRSILSKYGFYPDNFDSAENSDRSLKEMDADELKQFKEDLDDFIN